MSCPVILKKKVFYHTRSIQITVWKEKYISYGTLQIGFFDSVHLSRFWKKFQFILEFISPLIIYIIGLDISMFKIFGKYVIIFTLANWSKDLIFFLRKQYELDSRPFFFLRCPFVNFFFSTFFLRALFYHVRMLFSRFCLLIQSKKGKSAQVTYCPRSCQCHDQHGVECMYER